LIVIDEAHMIMSARGPVLGAILALARPNRIPVLLLTGTPTAGMVATVERFFTPHFALFEAPHEARPWSFPFCLDDETLFYDMIVAL
jgi:hypothetical protein